MKFQEQSQQGPSSHLEKKNEILDSLVKQVSVVKSFIKKQETFEATNFETLMPLLEKEHESLFTTFDESTVEKYTVYKKCLKEIDELDNFSEEFDYENGSKEEILKYAEEFDKNQDLYEKTDELLTPDVSFLEHLDTFYTRVKNIAIHNHEIRSRKQSPEDISVYLDDQGSLASYFLSDDVEEVKEDAFCTTFIIKEESWLKVRKENNRGFFVHGKDFTFIRGGYDNRLTNKIIKHEKTHHLLYGIPRYEVDDPAKRVQNHFKRVVRLKNLRAPDSIIKNELNQLLGHNAAREMIDSTQNEFLAEYEEGRRKNFGQTPEIELLDEIFGVNQDADAVRKETFRRAAQTLSTAGRHILNGHRALKILELNLEKEGFSEYLQEAKLQIAIFEKLFIKMLEQIKQVSTYGAILGEEADFEIKALIILLKPTSYHHILSYLKHEHGDFMSLIEANKDLFVNGDISHKILRKFCDYMKSSTSEIDQNIKNRVYEIIYHSIIGADASFDKDSLEDPEQAFTLLREFEVLLQSKSAESYDRPKFAREYFLETLLPWDPSLESFDTLPDNFFEGENKNTAQDFIKSNVFEEEFDEDQKQKTIVLLRRIGLL
jgi:hypothetical protein